MLTLLPLLTAHAQQEVCASYPPDRLRAELAAAEQALLALQVPRGASLLDEVHRLARCLDAVVDPSDLGQLARLQALRAFYEQDPEQLASWAQLALEVDPGGAWPIAEDHPVRRFVDPSVTPQPRGPDDVHVAHPRRGGVFLDGQWLELPEATSGSPHLVQVFDGNGARVDGWWQDGAAFPDVALSTVPTETAPPRWHEAVAPPAEIPEALRGWGPARKDTAQAYAAYLRKHPTGEHAAEARRRLDDKEWEAATEDGSIEAVRTYLERWPRGRNVEKAERVLEGEAFRAAIAAETREALVLFRGRYPRGAYAAEANRRLDDLAWADATRADTPEAYERYRFRWPQGQHVREARLAQEELEWDAATGSEDALRAFLEDWPHGSHAEEAAGRLAGSRFWRVALSVEGEGASTVVGRLRSHLRAQGFEVVTGTGPGPGTGLLQVRITGTSGLVGTLELRAEGLAEPLVTIRLKAAEPSQLAAWLVEGLPPLGRWRAPAP